jgi:hypothetical protein
MEGTKTTAQDSATLQQSRQILRQQISRTGPFPENHSRSVVVLPAQLLECYVGIKKALNPDSFRNLSRVVLLD